VLQKIHTDHGRAIWALVVAYGILGIFMLFLPRIHINGVAQVTSNLLLSIGSVAVCVVLAVVAIHVLFSQLPDAGGIFTMLGPIDAPEKADFDRDVSTYEKVRTVIGDVLTLIGLALVAYILYRIIGVVPIVLTAVGWKTESLTKVVGTGGATAISVVIGAASLLLWFVVLNFVFRKLGAKPS
jgi:hypothetical protein